MLVVLEKIFKYHQSFYNSSQGGHETTFHGNHPKVVKTFHKKNKINCQPHSGVSGKVISRHQCQCRLHSLLNMSVDRFVAI